MIVSIGLGDDGVNVCLDDEIDGYDPLRTVELCRLARTTFAEVYRATLTEDVDAVVEAEGE